MHKIILSVIFHTHKIVIWEDLDSDKAQQALSLLEANPEDWDGALKILGPSTTATNAADIEEAKNADDLAYRSDIMLDLSGTYVRRESISEACEQLSEFLTEQTC